MLTQTIMSQWYIFQTFPLCYNKLNERYFGGFKLDPWFFYSPVAEESHDTMSKKKSGVCYSKKFIGFLVLNVAVAYIVVIWLATKEPGGSEETSQGSAPKVDNSADEVRVNSGAVVSDNVACSNIGRYSRFSDTKPSTTRQKIRPHQDKFPYTF